MSGRTFDEAWPGSLQRAGGTPKEMWGGGERPKKGNGGETWMASVSAWPRCRLPVTLGGGRTITNLSASDSMEGLKNPDSSHHEYL